MNNYLCFVEITLKDGTVTPHPITACGRDWYDAKLVFHSIAEVLSRQTAICDISLWDKLVELETGIEYPAN